MRKLYFLFFVLLLMVVAPSPVEGAKRHRLSSLYYLVKLNSLIGLHIYQGNSAVFVGGQLGQAPFKKTLLYVGPEVSFSRFSDGSMLNILIGAWFEWQLFRSQTIRLAPGIFVGPTFTHRVEGLDPTVFSTQFELKLVHDINDLVSICGQVRPGIVGGEFLLYLEPKRLFSVCNHHIIVLHFASLDAEELFCHRIEGFSRRFTC